MSFSDWWVNSISSSPLFGSKLRWLLLRAIGVKLGHSRLEHSGSIIGSFRELRICDGVYINTGFRIFPSGGIYVGENVSMGPNVIIMTGTHKIGTPERRAADPTQFKPVSIGDGVWIGAGVIIHPGVKIGPGCVIGSGSLVTRNCEANGLYVGSPAIFKRYLDE